MSRPSQCERPGSLNRACALVGDTRLELMTSSVSGKRATNCANRPRWRRDLNPCTRICSPLPRLSATPPVRPGLVAAGTRPTPSGRRDSNPRPSPWQGDALPTEPRPRAFRDPSGPWCACNDNNPPTGQANRARRAAALAHDVRTPRTIGYRESSRAIGAVVARFVHTEEVTGSNPVSPTAENGSDKVKRTCRRVLTLPCNAKSSMWIRFSHRGFGRAWLPHPWTSVTRQSAPMATAAGSRRG